MANCGSLILDYFSFVLLITLCLTHADNYEDRKVYIVYMGSLPEGEYTPTSHHLALLQEVMGDSFTESQMVRSYKRSFNGFAAKLTTSEAQKLAGMKEVVSVFPNRILKLHTTRSWNFMGFNETTSQSNTAESDIIIGVIDTGIFPESPSFSDKGFGPAPKKWKGSCNGGHNFTCNKKIIGARFYETKSARDDQGHGTHTASTAAGNILHGASFYGIANGTARGGVPSARIAAYKVCEPITESCGTESIMAAFDDAIADGVDIITISIGTDYAIAFDNDPIAIGAFHAMKRGVFISQSAGNSGPSAGMVSSAAPWIFSIAASSIDRKIIDKVVLGNGKTLIGRSVNSFKLKGTMFPLVNASDVAIKDCWFPYYDQPCQAGCLNSTLAKGKIVLCNSSAADLVARIGGALGTIMLGDKDSLDVSFTVALPASALDTNEYKMVDTYMKSTKHPYANILKSEGIKDFSAPVVALFSSRGPNRILPEIIKPDVSAPGVDILAAFSPDISPTNTSPYDNRSVKFNILSGTSMACPHAAAVAAYVKSVHPDWSPAAIKSAIMTTAVPMNAMKNTDAEFAYGSGHIAPINAIHPGLVYDAYEKDYINVLCSIGYDKGKLKLITGDNSTCPKGSEKASVKDLNYPSMASNVTAHKSFTIKFHRTVTNVGHATSSYKAEIQGNSKLKIEVVPQVLAFKSLKEKKTFDVTVSGGGLSNQTMVSASLVWSDGIHRVRSPIVVHTIY